MQIFLFVLIKQIKRRNLSGEGPSGMELFQNGLNRFVVVTQTLNVLI